MNTELDSITDIPGIKVGHEQNFEAMTGCTVVLCESGAIGGIDQRGGAPGTRETDLLRPMHLVNEVHAVLLAGGSAFGLDAAAGVMQFLEESKVGYDTGFVKVPIVPAIILFDLNIGRADIRPDKAMGYMACLNATTDSVKMGNYGAGTGASIGKAAGMRGAMKSGIGSACMEISNEIKVGALIANNAFGDVIDPDSGNILAGTRQILTQSGQGRDEIIFANSLEAIRGIQVQPKNRPNTNTVIGVVATNAWLTKEEINKVAQMAQDGLARTIRPAHTMLDGDTIIALSLGSEKADVNVIGSFAAEVVASAIVRSVLLSSPMGGLPALQTFTDVEKDNKPSGKE